MADNNYGLISTRFYRIAEWIWRFAYLNLLWLGFSIIGIGVVGIFPATVALFAVLRKWLTGEPDVSIIKLFWETYKRDFIRANILGYVLVAFSFVIWFNYQYLGIVTGAEQFIILIAWWIAVILFVLLVLFIFPVYVHFELPLFSYFKTALLIAIASPLAVITLVIALYLAIQLFLTIPGLIPFYSMSIIGWLIMWTATHAFRRINRKRERMENNEDSIKYRWTKLKELLKSSND